MSRKPSGRSPRASDANSGDLGLMSGLSATGTTRARQSVAQSVAGLPTGSLGGDDEAPEMSKPAKPARRKPKPAAMPGAMGGLLGGMLAPPDVPGIMPVAGPMPPMPMGQQTAMPKMGMAPRQPGQGGLHPLLLQGLLRGLLR